MKPGGCALSLKQMIELYKGFPKPVVEWRRLSHFPAQMTLIYVCTPLRKSRCTTIVKKIKYVLGLPESWQWDNLFFTVLVIGAFVLCHFTQLIYVVLSTKLGTSQIPEELRTSMILLTAIHSTLNLIIYVFRSNEFKRAFKMFFTTPAALAQFANTNNTTARSCMSRLELSARDPRNNRLPSFLVPSPAENVTVITQDKQDPMVSFLPLQKAEHQEQLVQDSKTFSHKCQVVSACDQSRSRVMHTDATTS